MDIQVNVGTGKCDVCGAGSSVAGASPGLVTLKVSKSTICELCLNRLCSIVQHTVVTRLISAGPVAAQPSPFLLK